MSNEMCWFEFDWSYLENIVSFNYFFFQAMIPSYFTTRLLFSSLFPYLPLLFNLAFILIFKSFDSIVLCEGFSTEELKELINLDKVKHEELTKEAVDLEEKANKLSSLIVDNSSDRNADNAWDKVSDKLDEAAEVYAKIFTKEAKIKELEPEYSCGLPKAKNHEYMLKYKMWD